MGVKENNFIPETAGRSGEAKQEEIIRLLSSNHNEAYKYLYRYYYHPLVAFAAHYITSPEAVRDLVQETFIALLDVHRHFDSMLHLKAYLYNTVRNKCLNYLRHEKTEQEFIRQKLEQAEESFEQNLIEEEVYALLTAAVEMLSPQSREVMLLALDGLSNAEIAQQLGLSVETVKSYRKAGKKKIIAFLADRSLPAFLEFMACFILFDC